MRSGFIAAVSILVLGHGAGLKAGSLFYAIGPDNSSAPDSFNSIPAGGPGPAPLFNLGGALGFNGGLTYRSTDGRFYVMANDNSGNSTLESFTLGGPGTLTTAFSPGVGFLSGLAFDSADGNLYAVADDSGSGHSFLDRLNLGASTVTQVLDLGLGFEGGGLFTGGLTFDRQNGKLYVLGADINGVSRSLYEINLLTSTVTFQFNVGDGSLGFNGGLLFEPGNGLFYAISNDVNGASELNSFSLGGGAGSLIPLFSLGSGFNNVGLTEIPAVPEPATGLSFVTAVAALAALCRMRRCSDACPACGEVPKHRGKCSVCGLNNHAPRGCFVSSGFAPFLAERQGDSSPTYQMVTDCGAQEAGVAGETDRTSRAAACSPQR